MQPKIEIFFRSSSILKTGNIIFHLHKYKTTLFIILLYQFSWPFPATFFSDIFPFWTLCRWHSKFYDMNSILHSTPLYSKPVWIHKGRHRSNVSETIIHRILSLSFVFLQFDSSLAFSLKQLSSERRVQLYLDPSKGLMIGNRVSRHKE